MAFKKNNPIQLQNLESITISLAAPNDILERSYGEVRNPETINYRSYKPERDGLFCERIFGPIKDYECYCGKYKRIRYKGIVCDRCGVEVTEKQVRRERTGHIKLAAPVVHIWFFKPLPNKIAYLLGLSSKNLESVIYYGQYLVVQAGLLQEKGLNKLDLLTEEEYLDYLNSLPEENQKLEDDDPEKFIAKMGAEAIHELLARLDLDQLSHDLQHQATHETSQQRKSEALKRLRVVEAFREGSNRKENRPEWMVLRYLPIIPPELRPLVMLDGGRFASSDLNDLYRRVIIRNNRLKRLMEIRAPEVILRNEKRMLQEAVDALFDNSARKEHAIKAEGGRPLKSLSDTLKGKQGRFRQNLLGKRVDYSGRSVIVVGPTLQLHQCGLPKNMAAELFKPFIIRKLIERGLVKTVKTAKKMVDQKDQVIWEILENILQGHPVLLNRAPTLHRLSIQAFQPILVEGKAIQLHPLVCGAFNADFDGDQMAVHVPLSQAAILEAQILMLSAHNVLNPQDGSPITLPSQDMILGLYYMTKERPSQNDSNEERKRRIFYAPQEVLIAFNSGKLDLHASVRVRLPVENENGEITHKLIDTTTGRVLFNEHVPEGIPFINLLLTKRILKRVIGNILRRTGSSVTARFLDDIKELGFYWSFKGGLSFNLGDLISSSQKDKLLKDAQAEVQELMDSYIAGALTEAERYSRVIRIWGETDKRLTNALMKELVQDKQGFNSVYMMLDSGARGSKQQIKQLCSMRGLMAKPRKPGELGESIIEHPILSNFAEGLSIQEYFLSTHGARKGLADTALRTADAGFLTRRLVDIAQNVVVLEQDCFTLRGIQRTALMGKDGSFVQQSLDSRISGRFSLGDIVHPDTGKLIVPAGRFIDEPTAALIQDAGIESVRVRSVLTCDTRSGVCVKCYGQNLATGRIVEEGDVVGIIAAQSIGEPGTQLTLRTFHTGGSIIVQGTESSIKSGVSGQIAFDGISSVPNPSGKYTDARIVLSRYGEIKVNDPETGNQLAAYHVHNGSTLHVQEGQLVKKGALICQWDPDNAVIVSDHTGIAKFESFKEGVNFRLDRNKQTGHTEMLIIDSKSKRIAPLIHILSAEGEIHKSYTIPVGANVSITDGQRVEAGENIAKIPRSANRVQSITSGLPRINELFEARNPPHKAVASEIDGLISFGKIKRGKREAIITPKSGPKRRYLLGLSRHLQVQEGDFVMAGTPLTDGSISVKDILAIKGILQAQNYLINNIQEVYQSEGIVINDKHLEVIVRQMMQHVQIEDPGDTSFFEKEIVERKEFQDQNDWIFDMRFVTDPGDSLKLVTGQLISRQELRKENSFLKLNGKKLVQFRKAMSATAHPLVQGITKSSLTNPSWIAAASFQETNKVLSSAAIAAKRDDLQGLKESLIVGKHIPAGTGKK